MNELLSKRSSTLFFWIASTRPKTLIASLAPIAIGTALSIHAGLFSPLTFLFTLITGLSIQIGTNFANDLFDFLKGSDTEKRKGPKRPLQQGNITPHQMKIAMITIFLIGFLSNLYLIYRGGALILALFILATLLGIGYTAGKYSLAYQGLGDIFVLIFFGPVATFFTYTLQTGTFSIIPLIGGLAPGFFSVAILVINNLRDEEEDRKSNKKTLVVRLGAPFGKVEYALSLLIASSIPIATLQQGIWITPIFLGWSSYLIWQLQRVEIEPLFAKTALLQSVFTLFYCILCLI